MCQPCSSEGQMPGALQKIGENCGDGKAETRPPDSWNQSKRYLLLPCMLWVFVTGSENFIFLVVGSWHKAHQQYWLWSLQSWPCRSYPLVPARDLSLPPGPVSAICFLQFAKQFSESFLLFTWNLPSCRSIKIMFWIKGVCSLILGITMHSWIYSRLLLGSLFGLCEAGSGQRRSFLIAGWDANFLCP